MTLKKEQFNKLIDSKIVERFNEFFGRNKSSLFRGRDGSSKAASFVFEAGLDVVEEQEKKLKNKKHE